MSFSVDIAKSVGGTRRRFELRAEAYNFFNHTQFAGVGTVYTTPSTFGRVTSARDPRSMMLGARLQF